MYKLKPLQWVKDKYGNLNTQTISHEYTIKSVPNGKYVVMFIKKHNYKQQTATGFTNVEGCKEWVDGHIHEKMSKWFEVVK